MKNVLWATTILVLTGSAVAQDATKMPMTKASPDSLKWVENKALPPGAMVAVVVGDPTKGRKRRRAASEISRQLSSSAAYASLR